MYTQIENQIARGHQCIGNPASDERVEFSELTPGLRLDDLELRPGSHLVVLSDLPPHAEAQSHHVVFLAVCRNTALNVVQQGRLQTGALKQDQHSDSA